MKKKIKVRFNLGRGKNYMKWKIEGPLGVEYHSPTGVQLIMENCQLKNNRKTAEKIFNGMNKDVCAWIICDSIIIRFELRKFEKVSFDSKLKYNPRIHPYWTDNTGNDVDNKKYDRIVSVDYGLFSS